MKVLTRVHSTSVSSQEGTRNRPSACFSKSWQSVLASSEGGIGGSPRHLEKSRSSSMWKLHCWYSRSMPSLSPQSLPGPAVASTLTHLDKELEQWCETLQEEYCWRCCCELLFVLGNVRLCLHSRRAMGLSKVGVKGEYWAQETGTLTKARTHKRLVLLV